MSSLSSTSGQTQKACAPAAIARPDPFDQFAEALQRQRARLDRLASFGLLADRGNIHVAEIGQHQAARDRRRRHHQNVGALALVAKGEALVHAEAMLLVDHRETKIPEGDGLLKQRMRADHDVDFARGEAVEDFRARGALVAAGQQREPQAARHRERAQRLKMLARQNFGRRHQRRLPPGLDATRHGEQRDQRFS